MFFAVEIACALSFLQSSVVQADKQAYQAPDLDAIIAAEDVVPDGIDGSFRKRTPAWSLRKNRVGMTCKRCVGSGVNIVGAVSQDGLRNVESERVDRVLALGGLVARVCAQGQVEEIREDERQSPVRQRPESRGSPPSRASELGQIREAHFHSIKASRCGGIKEVVRVGERVVLQCRGLDDQDDGLNCADGACGLAKPLLGFIDARLIP